MDEWNLVDKVDTARAKEKQNERSHKYLEPGIFCRHCRSNVWGYRCEAHMKNEYVQETASWDMHADDDCADIASIPQLKLTGTGVSIAPIRLIRYTCCQ